MTTTIPCRAKNPDTCVYHGAQRRAEAALLSGDTDTWLRENEIMLRNSNIDEITDFIQQHAAPVPQIEPLTAQQVIELPVGSEAADADGNPWRKTTTGGWQRINTDGTLDAATRTSHYFAVIDKPTLTSMPAGTTPQPHYQPGYPKQVAWRDLQPGDQISGGKVVTVRPTTTTAKVNVTLEQADGTTKVFAATKYNKQTVVGNADTAPVFAQHDLQYRLNKAQRSLDERIQFGTGRATNFTYTVGGYAHDIENQVATPARTVYNQIADSLIRSSNLEKVENGDYIGAWGVDRDRLLNTLQSSRTFAGSSGRLAGLDHDELEKIDSAHRYVFAILTKPYGTVNSRGGKQERVALRRLMAALDRAYWEKPTPVAK